MNTPTPEAILALTELSERFDLDGTLRVDLEGPVPFGIWLSLGTEGEEELLGSGDTLEQAISDATDELRLYNFKERDS